MDFQQKQIADSNESSLVRRSFDNLIIRSNQIKANLKAKSHKYLLSKLLNEETSY